MMLHKITYISNTISPTIIISKTFSFCFYFPSQSGLFLLLCPSNEHFLWCGGVFPAAEAGVDMRDCTDDDVPSTASLLKFAALVALGEVDVDGAVGSYLLSNPAVVVEM